jgi:putative transposase
MLRGYKYRIYPNVDQKNKIDRTIGSCRLVYNLALEVKITAWKEAKKSLSGFDLVNQLVELKEDNPWMYEIDSQSLQASVRKVEMAFKNFFNGSGFPKFKNKKTGTQSFKCPNNTRRIDFNKKTLTIPKIFDIPIAIDRSFDGIIQSVTISRVPTGKYYASIVVQSDMVMPGKPVINPEKTVGVDVGIKSFVSTSDGKVSHPNRYFKSSLCRLKCLQERAKRKKIGSNNHKKAKLCIAILHEKIKNQRADYIHKITTGLIRDNQAETFVIEDLNVVGMMKNRKLSQAMVDVSFGELFRQIEYKCDWYGKNLIKIGRFEPSSKTCSYCGMINEMLTLKDREWTCSTCNSVHERDVNAAKNIKAMGLKQYSPEGIRVEPVERPAMKGRKEAGKYINNYIKPSEYSGAN